MSRRTPDGDSSLGPFDSVPRPDRLPGIDLELLGVHLVATCVAVYFAVRFDVGAWRGVVVGLVAYLVALLRHPERRES